MSDDAIKKLFGEFSFSHTASRKRQRVSRRGRLPKHPECLLVHSAKAEAGRRSLRDSGCRQSGSCAPETGRARCKGAL
jgi:hypothetical protein